MAAVAAASPAKIMRLQSVRGAGVCQCVLRLRCLFQWIDHEFGGWDWQCALQKKYMLLRDDKRRTVQLSVFIGDCYRSSSLLVLHLINV